MKTTITTMHLSVNELGGAFLCGQTRTLRDVGVMLPKNVTCETCLGVLKAAA